jgi:hypothetical protein
MWTAYAVSLFFGVMAPVAGFMRLTDLMAIFGCTGMVAGLVGQLARTLRDSLRDYEAHLRKLEQRLAQQDAGV